jgi:hypothetical protein
MPSAVFQRWQLKAFNADIELNIELGAGMQMTASRRWRFGRNFFTEVSLPNTLQSPYSAGSFESASRGLSTLAIVFGDRGARVAFVQ